MCRLKKTNKTSQRLNDQECGISVISIGPQDKLSLRHDDLSMSDLPLSSNVSCLPIY